MAHTISILTNLTSNAYDANLKMTSRRQCLKAVSIIMIAGIVAHGIDRAFYTIKKSSDEANANMAYFALVVRFFLFGTLLYSLIRMRVVITNHENLFISKKVFWLHILIYFSVTVAYILNEFVQFKVEKGHTTIEDSKTWVDDFTFTMYNTVYASSNMFQMVMMIKISQFDDMAVSTNQSLNLSNDILMSEEGDFLEMNSDAQNLSPDQQR